MLQICNLLPQMDQIQQHLILQQLEAAEEVCKVEMEEMAVREEVAAETALLEAQVLLVKEILEELAALILLEMEEVEGGHQVLVPY